MNRLLAFINFISSSVAESLSAGLSAYKTTGEKSLSSKFESLIEKV